MTRTQKGKRERTDDSLLVVRIRKSIVYIVLQAPFFQGM